MCSFDLVKELLDDPELHQAVEQCESEQDRIILQQFVALLQDRGTFLISHPDSVLQEAANRTEDSAPAIAAQVVNNTAILYLTKPVTYVFK